MGCVDLSAMPPKRTHLQSPNPVKYQAHEVDMAPSTPSSPVLEAIPVMSLAPPRSAAVGMAASPQPVMYQALDVDPAPSTPAPSVLLALPVLPLTPPRAAPVGNVVPPLSPSTNRSRFLHGSQPVRVCCNLDLMKSPAGAKIAISAICIAVFPASTNPDRRYIQLCDQYGSAGLTVWNANVSIFGTPSVGKLVTCKRLVVQSHNGKRCLTMARDSTIEIDDDAQHSVVDWWKGLLRTRSLNALEAHDAAENDIISLSGIVGQITEENKIVGGRPRVLTTINMVDATGKFLVRSWNHTLHQFQSYVDQPITIQRVRVTAFAGEKLAELLDGNGSVIITDFPGCDVLREWWNSS
jgi:hypothetical protein